MYIKVHALPSAKKERITKKTETLYYISVKEPAERNMANARIREILASEFAVPAGHVKLLTGHHSCGKMYSIDR